MGLDASLASPGARITPVAVTPAKVHFELEGQIFSLVPAEQWRRRGGRADGALKTARAVGRMEVDGERHIVVMLAPKAEEAPAPSIAEILTRREFEVAMLVAAGKCDKEIARALGISGYTVREHLRRAGCKLGVSRRTAIVSVVLRGLSTAELATSRERS
jgi:DNA-binding CsgD family transcriptional regulator